MIASHYAEPLVRHIAGASALLLSADDDAATVAPLAEGDEIRVLDCSRDWAWGYGPDGHVGYVRSDYLVA